MIVGTINHSLICNILVRCMVHFYLHNRQKVFILLISMQLKNELNMNIIVKKSVRSV